MNIHLYVSSVARCDHPQCEGHLGKFQSCRDEALYFASMEADASAGSCDYEGHVALVTLETAEVLPITEGSDTPHEIEIEAGHYVIGTATSGAVDVTRYDTLTEATAIIDNAADRHYRWEDPAGWYADHPGQGHVDYPHEPGRLYDCEACEIGPCMCGPGDAPCLSENCQHAETVSDSVDV